MLCEHRAEFTRKRLALPGRKMRAYRGCSSVFSFILYVYFLLLLLCQPWPQGPIY